MEFPIGFLGIGQAGGNIAKTAAKAGFPVAAINTSPEDLQAISDAVKHTYHVPGEVGAGKDRNIGKRVVAEHWEDMVSSVRRAFSSQDLKALALAFSLGGGTGSSVGPFLGDILTEALPGVTVFFVAVLPHAKESVSAKVNATDAFAELSAVEKAGATFIVDNEMALHKYPNASKGELYSSANIEAVAALRYLVDTTQKASAAGNFDRKDLAQVLATRGFATIGQAKMEVSVKDLAEAKLAVARSVMSSWEKSVFCPVEYRGIGPVRAAVLFDGPEGASRFVDPSVIFRDLGEPFELFEGSYDSGRSDGVVTTLLAGLTWPVTQMNRFERELEERKESIQAQIQTAYGSKFESKVAGWANGLKAASNVVPLKHDKDTTSSIMEKLANYQSR